MNQYESIFKRKSMRKFYYEQLGEKQIEDLQKFMKTIRAYDDTLLAEVDLIDSFTNKESSRKMIGQKAPYYLAYYTDASPNGYINAGYFLQQVSLYLTACGIGSCFMGSARPRKAAISHFEGKYVIVLGLGKAKGSVYRERDQFKRLKPREIAIVKKNNSLTEQFIEAVRLAPSGINRQPWRMVINDKKIHLFCIKRRFGSKEEPSKMDYIDIGCALAHMYVMAEELWVDAEFVRLEGIENQSFKNNQYVTSICIDK